MRSRRTTALAGWLWVQSRSYGEALRAIQAPVRSLRSALVAAALIGLVLSALPAGAAERPIRIVAFGDSLTAGFGVAAGDAFPARLQRALNEKGLAVEVVNAGVSGDTASGGLARLDWSVPDGSDAVIVELGANDALRGTDPAVTRGALEQILRRLQERRLPVLLCGMRAPPNMGSDYVRRFDAIYPELAAKYDVPLYPFFLEEVAADPALNQGDGLHPTAGGVEIIVGRILPQVEALIRMLPQARKPAG